MIHPMQSVPFATSDSTNQLLAEFEAARVEHNRRLSDADIEAESLRAAVAEWDVEHEMRKARLRADRRRLDNHELEVREIIDRCCDAYADDQRTARTQLRQQVEAVKAEVRRRLVEIGFIDGPVEALAGQLGIANDVVPRHPSVIAASQELRSAESFSVTSTRQANQAAREKCEARLEAAKQAALLSLA